MPTASPSAVLEDLLPEWQSRLQKWAVDRSLLAAAQDVLLLDGAPLALTTLVGEWSAGDFSSLPPIVLLSNGDMNGVMGAYAVTTGTIYLNADWLAGAGKEQVQAVLTEELGHHLDGLLNAVDTPGDEGELFAALLLEPAGLSSRRRDAFRQQDDHATLQPAAAGAVARPVELAAVSGPY